MTVDLLQTISLVSYILSAVLLLVSAALFFLLAVPKLFGDVTGSTARKAIENIRRQNESDGDKAYKPSVVNASRGKLTDKISPSGKLERALAGGDINVGTQKLTTIDLSPAVNETTVLNNSAAASAETSVLSSQSNCGFSVDYEIQFIESSEFIE